MLQLTVACLKPTRNRETQNVELEIGTDGWSLIGANLWVEWQVFGFGLPRGSQSGFGRIRNQSDPLLLSMPDPLAGYTDHLLTLVSMTESSCIPINSMA